MSPFPFRFVFVFLFILPQILFLAASNRPATLAP